MNERAQIGDPFELSLAFSRHLGRRDRCLLVDAIVDELGPYAPIPAFEDVRDDAVHWLESVPKKVRTTYLIELWHALPPEGQRAAEKFFAENRKEEARKAEARAD